MEIKIILLLTILLYSVIVSQSFSYIISLSNVQLGLNAPSYIALRQLTDKNYNAKFRWVSYASLLSNLALVIVCGIHGNTLLLWGAVVSFIALLADTWITIKGNLPINKIINSWTAEQYPADWASYRAQWLQIFRIRQALNISGFIFLLTGTVFSS